MPPSAPPDKPVQIQPVQARPFLKWAGGKRQLLNQLQAHFTPGLFAGRIRRYAEPFVGSGAVFFHLVQTCQFEEILLSDLNPELILVYRTVSEDVDGLVDALGRLQSEYLGLDEASRRSFYYQIRGRYNTARHEIDFERYGPEWVERACQAIFLNRTGYNGLFRVNSRGEFNVPFGRYKHPRLLNAENLRAASSLLRGVRLTYGDFEQIASFVDERTFVYLDPPYRPVSRTASFTSYSQTGFGDEQQLRLASFFRRLDSQGAALMLSNSDPPDGFFRQAYIGFRFERLQASRNINSNPELRGPISELLILNY